jgi:hypothetical protein
MLYSQTGDWLGQAIRKPDGTWRASLPDLVGIGNYTSLQAAKRALVRRYNV